MYDMNSANVWSKMPKETTSWPSLPPPSSPVPPISDITNPDGDFESQLDFFHRLGYSTEQIQAVLQKFGPNNNDRDKLLWELVKIAAESQIPPVTKMNVLLPRGDVPLERASVMVPVGPGLSRDESLEEDDSLRSIVIDGSNVAMSHGNKEVFSCLGIQLAVNFFLERGHTSITVIVPSWRNEKPRPDVPISDQHILRELEKKKLLVFTPSKRVAGKRVVCHDDRYIVRAAVDSDGVIVSNDLYRDLQREKPEWKRFIDERLLMYTFINNKFMPPEDPLGRHGPTLDNFLRKFPKTQKKQPCPYGNKCTYGLKCKFLHLERSKQSNQSLADELRTSQRHSPSHPTPPPGQSLSLVEDMAKMFLSSTPLPPKDHHQDNHPPRKNRDKKGQCKKEKNHKSQSSLEHFCSESALDSGLGSIDPQTNDLRDQHFGSFYGTSVYNRPQSAPCSCQLSTSCHGFQHQERTSCSDYPAYGMPPYPNYGPYSGGMQCYSHPPDFPHRLQRPPPQQMYWSDPYGANPRLMGGVQGEWDPNQASTGHKDPREVVRKKLLAIFSAPLVDKAMQLNPSVLDPQKLAGEILMLQSQGVAMR